MKEVGVFVYKDDAKLDDNERNLGFQREEWGWGG